MSKMNSNSYDMHFDRQSSTHWVRAVELGSRVSSHATVSHTPEAGFEAVLYLGLALQAVSRRMRDPASSAKRSALSCRMPALSRDSELDQRKRGPLEIEGVNGLMDCGIECIGVGEGLMGEMMRLEVAPDAFDVV